MAFPAIALECKSCGAELKGARGQLKSYFNALSGGRVGALTNGMEYEFFIDSAEPNHMDDEPFLSLSLKSLTNGAMRTDVIDTLERLTRARFDADHIIGQARQRLLKEELVRSSAVGNSQTRIIHDLWFRLLRSRPLGSH